MNMTWAEFDAALVRLNEVKMALFEIRTTLRRKRTPGRIKLMEENLAKLSPGGMANQVAGLHKLLHSPDFSKFGFSGIVDEKGLEVDAAVEAWLGKQEGG